MRIQTHYYAQSKNKIGIDPKKVDGMTEECLVVSIQAYIIALKINR